MSELYDIRAFLERIRHKNPAEMLSEAESEMRRMRDISHNVRGAPAARAGGSVEYFYSLERFYHFIQLNSFKHGTPQHEARLFLSVLRDAVGRGELPPDSLQIERQIESLGL